MARKTYQDSVDKILSKSGNCPTCRGIGKVLPSGPIAIGAKLPKCTTCSGKGKV